MDSLNRVYNESHCYQFDIRLKNLKTDLKLAGLNAEEVSRLRVSDFEFQYVPKEDKTRCQEVRQFIERHEWLGKMPHRPTHRFVATYQGKLAGVIVMATPNSFSNLLGSENQNLEKLISRGASISWSPKNLASALIMFSVRWMVKHTDFRVFTAYSDTEAKELGTIYQACNFSYLGNEFGARVECFDSSEPARGWFSDRLFRKASQYIKYAERLGYTWRPEWGDRKHIVWDAIPELVSLELKKMAKDAELACEKREVPKKHKYVYILGRTHKETTRLRLQFQTLHPEQSKLPYPKVRGLASTQVISRQTPVGVRPTNFAAAPQIPAAKISDGHLNDPAAGGRPQKYEARTVEAFLPIKELALRYSISEWILYRFIKTDPTFPYLNVGLRKKFVINEASFRTWMEERTKRQRSQFFHIPTGQDLLKRSLG
jgi:hypothetical protein